MKTVILSSQNKGKIKEISEILGKYDMEVITRDDAGLPGDEIEENGSTFEENSYIKAAAIRDMIDADPKLARYASSPVIADDSGLMVDALGGAPGIYSARYAGEGCTFEDDIRKLLGELEGAGGHQNLGARAGEKATGDSGVQMNFFQLDDPVLCQIRDEILGLDINNLTPLEALTKLNDIKKIVKAGN